MKDLSGIFKYAAGIAVEFGLLHATPLGGMLTGFFSHIFNAMGFDFAASAYHAAEAVNTSASIPTMSFNGTNLVPA